MGGEKLTPTAEKMRRLMHYGQMFQSHALHFFHLVSPDLLFGFDADPAIRNVIGVAHKYPDLAVQGVMMRKFGQEIIKATAGKKIHGTGRHPRRHQQEPDHRRTRRVPQGHADKMIDLGAGRAEDRQGLHAEHLNELVDFGSFPSNHLSLVRKDGGLDLYDGDLRAIDADGNKIIDHVDYQDYPTYIAEEVRDWSLHEVPVPHSLGPEGRMVPRGTAGAAQHLRLHRHAAGREGARGVQAAYRAASPTTSRWPTTGRA